MRRSSVRPSPAALSLMGVISSNRKTSDQMQAQLEKHQAVTDTKLEELTREVRAPQQLRPACAGAGGKDEGRRPPDRRSGRKGRSPGTAAHPFRRVKITPAFFRLFSRFQRVFKVSFPFSTRFCKCFERRPSMNTNTNLTTTAGTDRPHRLPGPGPHQPDSVGHRPPPSSPSRTPRWRPWSPPASRWQPAWPPGGRTTASPPRPSRPTTSLKKLRGEVNPPQTSIHNNTAPRPARFSAWRTGGCVYCSGNGAISGSSFSELLLETVTTDELGVLCPSIREFLCSTHPNHHAIETAIRSPIKMPLDILNGSNGASCWISLPVKWNITNKMLINTSPITRAVPINL